MDWANGRNTGVSRLRRTGRTIERTRRTPSYWAEYRTRRTGRTGGRSRRSGVRNPGRVRLGRTGADGADWGTGGRSGRSGLRNPGWGGLGRLGRMGRTRVERQTGLDGADSWTGALADGADGAN